MFTVIKSAIEKYRKADKTNSIQTRLMEGTFGLSDAAMRGKLTEPVLANLFQTVLVEKDRIAEFDIFALDDSQRYEKARNFMYRTGNTIVELERQENDEFFNLRSSILSFLDKGDRMKSERYEVKSLWALVIVGLIFDSIERKGGSVMDGQSLVSHREYIPMFFQALLENGGQDQNVFRALFEPKSNLKI